MASPERRVGVRIVSEGIPAGVSPEVTIVAAGGILLALRARLGRWIGVDAFDALLDRALVGTRERGGPLRDVRWAPGSEAPLSGIDVEDAAVTGEALRDAVAVTLDDLTGLLGRFIGDELANRLVLHDWEGRASDPQGDS